MRTTDGALTEVLSGCQYAAIPALSLAEFSRFALSSRSYPNGMYLSFFGTSRLFEAAVDALHETGRLPRRADGTYRAWDGYVVLRELVEATSVKLTAAGFEAPPAGAPKLSDLGKLGELWWETVEAALVATDALARARVSREVVPDETTGQPRAETPLERRGRLQTTQVAVLHDLERLATLHAADGCYWADHLRAHASLVLALKAAGQRPLSRLCARHLAAATELAVVRLARPRRAVRELVGTLDEERGMPALSAATFSRGARAYDLALDLVEDELSHHNATATPALQLSVSEAHELIDFLRNVGLEMWYTELTAVTWDQDLLEDMTGDQFIAASYGRIRTLAALLEEAIFSLAESIGDDAFTTAITNEFTLNIRLKAYLNAPIGKPTPVASAEVKALAKASAIFPPVTGDAITAALDALQIRPGEARCPQSPAESLASLLVLRNLTSHRFPVITEADGRPEWLDEWRKRLPAINHALLRAALVLWALRREFSTTV